MKTRSAVQDHDVGVGLRLLDRVAELRVVVEDGRAGDSRERTALAFRWLALWLATFALMTLVLDISGSAAAVGGVLALRLAPATLAGPLIGMVATRFGRRSLLVGLDFVRGGVALVIPLVATLWWVYPWTITIEVAAVVAIAARDASIRDLVDEHNLPIANGMVMGATYGAIPLGAGAFAAVSAAGASIAGGISGTTVAFWVDAATFAVSALLIRRIVEIPDRPDLVAGTAERVRLSDARRVPLVRATLPPIVAASLGIGTLFSLGVTFVRDTLGADQAQFGSLVAVFGLGAAGGLGLRELWRLRGVGAVRLGVGVMGSVMVVMAFSGGMPAALVTAFAFGAGGAYAIVSGLTVLQVDLPAEWRLISLGAFHVAVRMALAVGALTAGLAVDLLGERMVAGLVPIRLVLVVSGALAIGSAVAVRDRVGDRRQRRGGET